LHLKSRHSNTWDILPIYFSGYFGDGVLQTICPDWPGSLSLWISPSQVARTTGVYHQCLASQPYFLFILNIWV
jgi:hypothetical protein